MAGIDIANKVKKGLAKATLKTGADDSPLAYKIQMVTTPGDPINPGVTTETPILLLDAVFNSLKADNELILQGDRRLVSNGDIEILPGDTIEVDDKRLNVVSVDIKKPAGVPLAYISQVRAQ